MDIEKLTELIDLVYAAALDVQIWPHVLESMAAFFDCSSSAMRIIDTGDFHIICEISSGSKSTHATAYTEHFAVMAPHLDKLKMGGAATERIFVVDGHEVTHLSLPDDHIEQQEGDCLSGFVFRVADRIVHIALESEGVGRNPDFSESLSLLVPHLHRAFLVSKETSELKFRMNSMEQALNHFSSGVIFVNGEGEAVFLNRRAREIVATMYGLHMVAGQIVCATSQSTQQLRQIIAEAIEQGEKGGNVIGAMRVSGFNDAKIDMSIVAVPLHPNIRSLAANGSEIRAALLVGSPSFASGVNPETLQLLYNLTGAEARLSIGLAMGKSLANYCEESGISVGTARGYLKQVFQKTVTNRQTELISLLRSIPFYLEEA